MQSRIIKAFFFTSVSLIGAGCTSTSHQAPVEDRRVASAPVEVVPVVTPTQPAAKIVSKPEQPRGLYVVKRGDTLYKIALDHGRNYSDLVVWNNLKNPNDIKADQVLKVAPPDTVLAANGGQVVTSSSSPVNADSKVASQVALPQPSSVVLVKNTPRGDKKPFSESVLAELQRGDAAVAVASGVNAADKKQDKSSEATGGLTDGDSIDWIWPVESKAIAPFDEVKNKGIDFAGRSGQDIMAAAQGRVMYVGSGIRGYGNLVILRHSNNLLSAYAHNKLIVVKEGQNVSKGQKIAEMGNSDSDTIKLHFEIRLNGKSVDPARYLPPR